MLNFSKELVIWPNGKISTGETLLDFISRYQSVLPAPKEYVLLASPFDEESLSFLLACIANGNPVIIYPKGLATQKVFRILTSKKVKHALVQNFFLKCLLKWNKIKSIALSKKDHQPIKIIDVEESTPALLSFSSGSTGINKSIERSHLLLSHQVNAIHLAFNAWADAVDFPLFANILLYNLCYGKKTIVPDIKNFDLQNLSPDKIAHQLQKNKIGTLTGNEYYFTSLCSYLISNKIKIKNIQAIGIGGSPISNRLISDLTYCFPNAVVQIIYGTTEAEPISIKQNTQIPEPACSGYNVGKIHPGIELVIQELYHTTVLDTKIVVGEVLVKGLHVGGDKDEQGFLHTGDYGYLLNEELHLSARSGNTNHLNGVQHLQIEHCIQANLGIRTAVVVKENSLLVYSEKKIDPRDIEKVLFITFNYKFPLKVILKKIPKDPRHLSKILYYEL